ncbi:MAG TPA: PEP-CTERM sorting domain-containing protein [Candidatus Acidoferrum sp.]|jgi:hypothetical protein|nr:PEP-CTERM sorting domain-containing protein [Candidatus Acidoferrum sp.]
MQRRRFNLAVYGSFVLIVVAFMPTTVLADSISITPLAPLAPLTTLSVLEGKAGSHTFTITNKGRMNGTIRSLVFKSVFKNGDKSDVPIFGPFTGTCAVGLVLAPGASCTLVVNFNTPPNDGPNGDHNFGITLVTVSARLTNGNLARGSINIKVSDVPEPSTLLLMGTGLAGMAGALRRKLCM